MAATRPAPPHWTPGPFRASRSPWAGCTRKSSRRSRDLIQFPSISPNYPGQDFDAVVGGESRCADLLAEVIDQAGADVEVFGKVAGRDNAVGRIRGIGGGRGRSLIFNGHMDVVPPGPSVGLDGRQSLERQRWHRDRVWGRGASDMKAGIVAQAMAARALRDARGSARGRPHPRGRRRRGDDGAQPRHDRLHRARLPSRRRGRLGALRPPSPLAICPVSPGVLWSTLRVEGKATHTSMRARRCSRRGEAIGVSAVDKIFLSTRRSAARARLALTKPHRALSRRAISRSCRGSSSAPEERSGAVCDPRSGAIDVIVWYTPTKRPTASDGRVGGALARSARATPGCGRIHRSSNGGITGPRAFSTPSIRS